MLPDYSFQLVNERLGDWIEGIWYSQTYSLYSVVDDYSSSRWNKYLPGYSKQTTYRTAVDDQWEEFNPVTGQYEPKLGDPSNERLRLAYDRHTSSAAGQEWAAWERDKYGNDPLPEDLALDKELAKYLDTDSCCDFCGKSAPLNDGLLCRDCEFELEEAGMAAEWISNSRRVQA